MRAREPSREMDGASSSRYAFIGNQLVLKRVLVLRHKTCRRRERLLLCQRDAHVEADSGTISNFDEFAHIPTLDVSKKGKVPDVEELLCGT